MLRRFTYTVSEFYLFLILGLMEMKNAANLNNLRIGWSFGKDGLGEDVSGRMGEGVKGGRGEGGDGIPFF